MAHGAEGMLALLLVALPVIFLVVVVLTFPHQGKSSLKSYKQVLFENSLIPPNQIKIVETKRNLK